MYRIKVLPDIVKSKIAAGEVVSGPASVVKELLENAVDSGASSIELEIVEAGLKKITCRDNGSGIHTDDIRLAVTEHATSKISDVYDIEGIQTYGFRGEALSSIASISTITLLTRSVDQETGARLYRMEEHSDINDYAGPAGTTVIVENLFYNVPARKKFLKNKRTEMRYVREEFLKIALVNHRVAFSYSIDGKRSITLPAVETLEKRVTQVYGNDVIAGVYFETLKDLKVTISGFLSKPTYLKPSRTMQVLYINKRPVDYKYFGFILSRAYEAIAIKGKYPVAIVFIDIDPGLVDVNIHPAKKEVKLFDQRYIDSLIYGLAEKALNRSHNLDNRRFVDTAPQDVENRPVGDNKIPEDDQQPQLYFGDKNNRQPDSMPHSTLIKESAGLYREFDRLEQDRPAAVTPTDGDYRIIGVLFRTYILVEKDEAMQMIDFHAAHERMVFDTLMNTKNTVEQQELMFPVMCELPINDFTIVMENIDYFHKIGFDIEDFSDNTITIRAVPATAGRLNIEKIIYEFIDSVKEEQESRLTVTEKLAATIACHSAKRAGDNLSSIDINYLVREIMEGNYILRCPHGRPFVYTLARNDIERMFKRQ